MTATSALIVIDMQNDFCEGGALAVTGASEIIAPINEMMRKASTVVLSQDWHPAEHRSFASQHANHGDYDVVEMPYGAQVLWPDHCVQGTKGAEFHADLATDHAQTIIRKGFRPDIDSYSAFYENDRTTPTGLAGYLQACGVTEVTLVGLALDFCVQYTALDARELGLNTQVIVEASKAIDLDGSRSAALQAMKSAGVVLK